MHVNPDVIIALIEELRAEYVERWPKARSVNSPAKVKLDRPVVVGSVTIPPKTEVVFNPQKRKGVYIAVVFFMPDSQVSLKSDGEVRIIDHKRRRAATPRHPLGGVKY